MTKAENLAVGDEAALDALQKQIRMVIRRTFGEGHSYQSEYGNIVFAPRFLYSEEEYKDDWVLNKKKMFNLLETMLGEIEVFGLPVRVGKTKHTSPENFKRVFISHGHDIEMREATTKTIKKLGLEPVILEEQASEGRTAIEKLVHYSDVSFAVILFSPDDLVYSKDGLPSAARPRARQNVVLELGYLISELGRENVLVLYRKVEGFEKPSVIDGIVYVPYDELGAWKKSLIIELQARGHMVNLDKLLRPEAVNPEWIS
jgi:hypothetical protein